MSDGILRCEWVETLKKRLTPLPRTETDLRSVGVETGFLPSLSPPHPPPLRSLDGLEDLFPVIDFMIRILSSCSEVTFFRDARAGRSRFDRWVERGIPRLKARRSRSGAEGKSHLRLRPDRSCCLFCVSDSFASFCSLTWRSIGFCSTYNISGVDPSSVSAESAHILFRVWGWFPRC